MEPDAGGEAARAGLVERVTVELGSRSYDVAIGSGLLDRPDYLCGPPGSRSIAIVTNPTVGALYADRLMAAFEASHPHVVQIALPDGEAFKNWDSLNAIFDALLAAGCDRQTLLVALGGGVIGDLTGFAAACYMRGVPFMQVPTTLLAQVDSSVGGKTGINHRLGKNMIGAFHQPFCVVVDIDTLATLPRRELIAGLAEVIKYGVIADDAFLAWIEAHSSALLSADSATLVYAVKRSCEIKAAIVGADEREQGLRAVLNFGHTFAHAIETGLGYGAWLHGEAVGCGMAMAADLSVRSGLLEPAHAARISMLLQRVGLPTRAPSLGTERYIELMRLDKKASGGQLRFVLADGPGRAVVRGVNPAHLVETIETFCGSAVGPTEHTLPAAGGPT